MTAPVPPPPPPTARDTHRRRGPHRALRPRRRRRRPPPRRRPAEHLAGRSVTAVTATDPTAAWALVDGTDVVR